MIDEATLQRLAELTRKYRSLSPAEEREGKGEGWHQEYWSIVDRLIDTGQLDGPLDDAHLLDSDFFSDKYDAFVRDHRERRLPWYYKAARWVVVSFLRLLEGRQASG